ncbi:MAG TPA: hypothetical protein VJ483_05070 [Holophagaceae bacterium]|nr:hypothetical protein [Holophagaceae bacterium]
MSGAVFTTNAACGGVDLNLYDLKTDVYLNGGPAHPGAAGLPDGDYSVQVTTPGGILLGSTLGAAVPAPVHITNGNFDACYQVWALCLKASDGTQGYDDTTNPGGEYKVWVSQDPTFTSSDTKTDAFKVRVVNPPPPGPTRLRIHKFYDANANGIRDAADPELTGWKVSYTSDSETFTIRFTDACDDVAPGTYTIYEFMPKERSWFATTPMSLTVTVTKGQTVDVWFGNLCLGGGGGHTLGFWSNRNGAVLYGADDQAQLTYQCLRAANGFDFDPASYSVFRTWILSANSVNMAYMLSAQYAAAFLNRSNGFVPPGAIVYAPGTNSANSMGFARYTDLLAETNAELCAHVYTVPGSPYRDYQGALKNALDAANNDLTFVQPAPCPFSF